MVQCVGGKDVICVAYLLSLHSLKQLVVSKCLVPCSPFQAILGKHCHAVLLEDVVTGLFLYGHQTTAQISPGDHLQPGSPGLQLQTVLTQSSEGGKGVWGILSPPASPKVHSL